MHSEHSLTIRNRGCRWLRLILDPGVNSTLHHGRGVLAVLRVSRSMPEAILRAPSVAFHSLRKFVAERNPVAGSLVHAAEPEGWGCPSPKLDGVARQTGFQHRSGRPSLGLLAGSQRRAGMVMAFRSGPLAALSPLAPLAGQACGPFSECDQPIPRTMASCSVTRRNIVGPI